MAPSAAQSQTWVAVLLRLIAWLINLLIVDGDLPNVGPKPPGNEPPSPSKN